MLASHVCSSGEKQNINLSVQNPHIYFKSTEPEEIRLPMGKHVFKFYEQEENYFIYKNTYRGQYFSLTPAKFEIRDTNWHLNLAEITENCKKTMGITADFKLETAGLYTFARNGFLNMNPVKNGTAFGTVFVVLPSNYTGGTFRSSVSQKLTSEISFSGSSTDGCQFFACFNDANFQLSTVTSGYVLCLAYRMVLSFPTDPKLPMHNCYESSTLRYLAKQWSFPEYFLYYVTSDTTSVTSNLSMKLLYKTY